MRETTKRLGAVMLTVMFGASGCVSDQDEPFTADGPLGVAQSAVTQSSAPWHLDRLDQRSLPLSTTYTYSCNGEVPIYVVSSGIHQMHPQFGGRATLFYRVPNGSLTSDCGGEGTAMAGIAGGQIAGVAKLAPLKSVTIIPCTGASDPAETAKAINYIANVATPPGVVVIGPWISDSVALGVRMAINNVVAAGFTTIVSVQPGGPTPATLNSAVIRVAATTSTDAIAFNPSSGALDLRAPGQSVVTTSPSGTTTVSGNAYAAAAVAGVAAQYLQLNPTATPAAVKSALMTDGTTISTTTTKLVHGACP